MRPFPDVAAPSCHSTQPWWYVAVLLPAQPEGCVRSSIVLAAADGATGHDEVPFFFFMRRSWPPLFLTPPQPAGSGFSVGAAQWPRPCFLNAGGQGGDDGNPRWQQRQSKAAEAKIGAYDAENQRLEREGARERKKGGGISGSDAEMANCF
ncbi:hypothetical protein L484_004119 [Morus notabilis]|uniref:Uncharacterized protein n=1 Tax=Morus notabilis TaxID=981085 RepID=W9R2X6_9ROSA|nr:hypothetical protein L484_004119 [Morus notabilis]